MVEIKDFCPTWSLHDASKYHWPFLSCLPALSLTSAGPHYPPCLGLSCIKAKTGCIIPPVTPDSCQPSRASLSLQLCLCWSKEVWQKSITQKTQFCHNLNISWGHVNRSYISDAQNFETICFHFLILFQRRQSTLIRQEWLITTSWFCFSFLLNFYSLGSLYCWKHVEFQMWSLLLQAQREGVWLHQNKMTQQEWIEQLQQLQKNRVRIFITFEIFQFVLVIVFVMIFLLFLGYYVGRKKSLRQKYQSFPWISNLKSQVLLQNSSNAAGMSFVDIFNIKTDSCTT